MSEVGASETEIIKFLAGFFKKLRRMPEFKPRRTFSSRGKSFVFLENILVLLTPERNLEALLLETVSRVNKESFGAPALKASLELNLEWSDSGIRGASEGHPEEFSSPPSTSFSSAVASSSSTLIDPLVDITSSSAVEDDAALIELQEAVLSASKRLAEYKRSKDPRLTKKGRQ